MLRCAPVKVHLLDGNDARATELARVAPRLELVLTGLPSGFSTSNPDPVERARGMVLAADVFPCCAESIDITTVEGNSLRLELDSENDVRFCKWWRETAVRLHLCVALRTSADAEVALFRGEVAGRIADKPAGPRALGWERLFVPDGFDDTLAELVARPELSGSDAADPVGLRSRLYGELVAALAERT
jgi:hypothetical protein